MASMQIQGAVVAITGGGRGIGRAIAERLIAAGAQVAIGDIDEALAVKTGEEIGAKGFALDVRERASVEQFIAATEAAYGPLAVLINNAGIMPAGDFLAETDAASDTQIDINLRGVILGCKVALPGMVQRGRGHIVNIASMAGHLAVPGLAVYCATKFAVVGLTDTLREEFRDAGVGFSTVCPAKVSTELAAGTELAGRGVPTATPEQVAQAVLAGIEENLFLVTVPRYLSSVPTLQSLTPNWLLRGLRRSLGDRRVLEQIDQQAREHYNRRIGALEKH